MIYTRKVMECLPGKIMNIKEIKKNLEEFEDNQDKLDYLYKLLDKNEDEELINEIKILIEGLEESLENKLEQTDIPIMRKAVREIDFNEVEEDVETIQRNISQRNVGRPDLTIRQNQDEDNLNFNYSSNNNYSSASLYNPGSFDYQTLQNSFDNDVMKQNLVRENILDPERVITEVEKENLSKKLRENMPGASEEKILMYQAKISDELRKDEKTKYIARLK